MNCSTARTGRPQSCTLWALLLFGCLCRWVSAIVCEIHARDGLEEVVAATAAVAAERQMLMHLVPLCRVPYLVNSPLQPRDLFHVGVEEGGERTAASRAKDAVWGRTSQRREDSAVCRPAAWSACCFCRLHRVGHSPSAGALQEHHALAPAALS